ncbi:hypothetical protein HPP92_019405 [Vanilla planifolia]|uniref:RING-type E3 ubiquitin transferase n=1 Tax=Vanilla planifolia TaxID=51239 RepID=A0A835Q6V9_VANPL|nr:hypothetical protein HPP92_019405 [Vanilla planifolia]
MAARSFHSIVSIFESGHSPDPDDLLRVLDHLRIRTWIDCFAEVAFLEEEVFADEDGSKSAILWSSMGFMLYALIVLFDLPPDGNRGTIREFYRRQESAAAVEFLNVEGLRCPISLELMRDPVTVSTGQTYERSSILRWLKSGNKVCPVTGEKLVSSDLIPNSAVRRLIDLFCLEKGIILPNREIPEEGSVQDSISCHPCSCWSH